MKKFLLELILGLLIVSGFIVTTPANAFALHDYQTGLCLDVSGWVGSSSAIIVSSCNGSPTQQWTESVANSPSQFTANFISDGAYVSGYGSFDSWYWSSVYNYNLYYNAHYLSNGQANFQSGPSYNYSLAVIGVRAGVIADGTPLIIWNEQLGAKNQLWTSVFINNDFYGHACYALVNFASSYGHDLYVMGVSGGKTKSGTPVILWQLFVDAYGNPDYFGHPDQYWCVY